MPQASLTPVLRHLQKNDDGIFVFHVAMNDAQGNFRGMRNIVISPAGAISVGGVDTGQTLTGAQMTALSNNWTAYQSKVDALDAAGKLPF